jgi:hypothetical protein
MYFCSSLNLDLLCYLSVHYRSTLECLDVIDSITEPALRYHNLFRSEPDPLVLLAWQCKKLTSLTIIGLCSMRSMPWHVPISFLGYEILETNLLAIAKLRPQLHRFNVCADCIMSLQYDHVQLNRSFVTNDEAFIQYGICTTTIQSIVSGVSIPVVVYISPS